MDSIGVVVLELAPGENNPRNSEGDMIALRDGRLLFAYSRFTGELGHDDAPSDIVALVSTDDGTSWGDERTIVTAKGDNAQNVMSVNLRRMGNGDLALFYCIRAGANDIRTHLRRSADEGENWDEAKSCVEPAGYFVMNNDRVVRLATGRWIIPVGFHRNGYDSYDKNRVVRFDSCAVDVFFLSDDDGETWTEAPTKCLLPFTRYADSGLQEPGILELKNGVLRAWARTRLGRQWEMYSFDQGESWTAPEPSRFTSPCSPLSMKRAPDSDKIVAVWNPIPNYQGREGWSHGAWTGGRTPLVLSTSIDEGKSWSDLVVLENEPDHGYCYTSIQFTDSSMFLAYCAGGVADKGCLNRLRVRKIPLDRLP